MPRVFVTRSIPDEGIKMLQEKGFEVSVGPDHIPSRRELLQGVKGVDALLSVLTERIDREVMDAAGSKLKIIANYAVGFDNIDLTEAKKRGITVTNTPTDKVTEAVAEHTFALMLSLARRIPEADAYAKAQMYKGWDPKLLLGVDLYGKILGIVGLGRIGTAVARRAVKGFGMKVLYSDIRRSEEFEKEFGAEYKTLEKLLSEADFISLHVPLLPSTRHLISTEQFSLMKKTAYLVNTARGPIVDEKALLRALKTGRIAGAGLDVFECEPAIDCDIRDNLELKAFDNVILTPHTASGTWEARQSMSRQAALNILAFFEGKEPPNPVK